MVPAVGWRWLASYWPRSGRADRAAQAFRGFGLWRGRARVGMAIASEVLVWVPFSCNFFGEMSI